jgi:GTP cyclohydrolase II
MRLLTNRPSRIAGVDGFDLEVVEQVLLRSSADHSIDATVHTTH